MNTTTVLEQTEKSFHTAPAQNKSVLVIEDEIQFARFLQAVLEDHGFNARIAPNAEEALRAVEDARPDLITLDLLMPGKTGIKLYRELRTREDLKNTRIVILTGLDSDSQGLCSYNQFFSRISDIGHVAKPDAYLTKPIDTNYFIHQIYNVLDH